MVDHQAVGRFFPYYYMQYHTASEDMMNTSFLIIKQFYVVFLAYQTSIIQVPDLTIKVHPNGRESAKITSKKQDK